MVSLHDVSQSLHSGKTSCVDTTVYFLERIQRHDPALHAFIALEAQDARSAAKALDLELRNGHSRGPLHGIPMAIKDIFERSDKSTSAGSRVGGIARGSTDAAVVRRLRAAGAVVLGTLNLDEYAAGGTGDNPHFGRAKNPWDLERITGGSSSGTAAAVAARLVPAAIGSDTGGSLRLPAAFCGVTALKPTWGSISNQGVFARARPFDTIGPAAGDVAACRLLFEVLSEPRPDAQSGASTVNMRQLRMGSATTAFRDSADPRVLACIEDACAIWECMGVVRSEVDLPDLDLMTRLHQVIVKSDSALLHAATMRGQAHQIGFPARSAIEAGLFLPAGRQQEALAVRSAMLDHFVETVFTQADVVVLPVVGTVAPRYAQWSGSSAAAIVRSFAESGRACRFVNYLGLPALALPCGFVDGMPVGLQLIARPYAEDLLLAAGDAFQAASRWHLAAPSGF